MKSHLRNYVASAMLLLPAALTLGALPSTALAQPAAPEVRSLAVDADDGLEPGSRLQFRLFGTPRVQASVRIRGLRENIALREVQPGVYTGSYTVKRVDRLDPGSDVRATLRQGNRTITANYELREAMALRPVPVPPPPVAAPAQPRIERFGMLPIERIEPGAELVFAVEGMAGAQVSVDLPGVERDLRLRETRPGHYEGAYTIRRNDDLNPNRPLVATLRMGDRSVQANMNILVGRPGPGNRPPGADNRAPVVGQLSPAEGTTVPAGPPIVIGASFGDPGGSGVDPASVRMNVSGRNVTPEAQITRQTISFRGALPPGRHTVEVTARDQAGNAVSKSWSFDVAAAAPANVPVRVTNHGNNGQVGQGPVQVQGQTVPNATVAVTVMGVAPVVNLTQRLFSQTIQADNNGNFAFVFTPQIPIPGARYDITLQSSRGNLQSETRLTLVQR